MQAGVYLHAAAWTVVQPSLVTVERPASHPGQPLRPEDWQEDFIALTPVAMPGLEAPLSDQAWPQEEFEVWRLALEAVRGVLRPGVRHLVLAWPDEALWSTTLTLAGPVTAEEMQAWIPQELAAVLPCELDEVSWDVQLPSRYRDVQALSARPRDRILRWLRPGRWGRMSGAAWRSSGDVTVRCWALPKDLAQALVLIAARLRLASLSIEPQSVAWERATGLASSEDAAVATLSMITARGAACRTPGEGPNLLHRRSSSGWWRIHDWAEDYLPWLVALAVTSSAGVLLGASQASAWRQSAQHLEQRRRMLQSQLDERALEQQRREQSRQLAQAQHTQRQARQAHNLQFVQALQGLAVTLPQGMRWQQLGLRPHQMELQALALDAQAMTQWLAIMPPPLQSVSQPRMQWRPWVEPTLITGGQAAAVIPASLLELNLHWAWSPAAQGPE
jgi:hypothetical protein